MVAPLFIGALIAIFQTTLFLFAQANLQSAAVEGARLLMTGQAQNGGMTQSQFQSTICPMVQTLFNCSNLVISVQNCSSGCSTSAPQMYNAQGQLNPGTWDPGSPGDLMVVELAYPWSVISGPLGFTLANLPGGTALMMGVTAFRVEPYGS